jgi:hypothetical protein
LLAIGPSAGLIPVIGGVGAEIAFAALGLIVVGWVGCQKGPAWRKGASFEAQAAANAYLFVHPSHIAMIGVCCQRTRWTDLHTGRLDALAAWLDGQIIWKGLEGVLHDLDPGEREALHTFVDQGTGQHAA